MWSISACLVPSSFIPPSSFIHTLTHFFCPKNLDHQQKKKKKKKNKNGGVCQAHHPYTSRQRHKHLWVFCFVSFCSSAAKSRQTPGGGCKKKPHNFLKHLEETNKSTGKSTSTHRNLEGEREREKERGRGEKDRACE